MEISLHFLSRNSLQNASFSPCTPTTSQFCPAAVATSADCGPSGSSIGMCVMPCPEVARATTPPHKHAVPLWPVDLNVRGMYVTEHHLSLLPHPWSLVGQSSLQVKGPRLRFLRVPNPWNVIETSVDFFYGAPYYQKTLYRISWVLDIPLFPRTVKH